MTVGLFGLCCAGAVFFTALVWLIVTLWEAME